MDFEKSRVEFENLQKKIAAINHAICLLFYDAETIAPPETAANRICTLEVLNDEIYNLKFGDKTEDLMNFLWEHKDRLNQIETRSLEIMRKNLDKKRNVPKEEYIEYELLLTKTQDAWHRANEEHDLAVVSPYLKKVFDKVREMAAYGNPEMDPYEYCLDSFEPGINLKTYDEIFDRIKKDVIPLLQKISEKPAIDDSCLKGDFSSKRQERLALYIMELLGLNLRRVGLATAEHPFSTNMGSHFDERIATKYSRKDFTFSLYTMLYECGHVLSEMGQDDAVGYTVIDGSATMGFLESQMRFYENMVGRSKTFINFLYPKLQTFFADSLRKCSPDELYLAVNKVTKGPIRMGSDEVTNNLHVLIRYEIEKAMMDKSMTIQDLPDAWAEKYREYLGVEVKDPTQGVLQDIHWADGAIGSFPTAVLGNVYSAVIVEKMREDLDFETCLKEGNFTDINKWLREHFWRWSGIYDTGKIMEQYVGVKSISSEPYIKYLTNKYSEIYNL